MLGAANEGDNGQTVNAINSGGEVVGRFRGNSQNPYIWRPGIGMTFMGIFGVAWDVNDASVVTGDCGGGCGGTASQKAFVWSTSGGVLLLPAVAGLAEANYEGLAINNAGVVVGRYNDGATNQQGIFRWSAAPPAPLIS